MRGESFNMIAPDGDEREIVRQPYGDLGSRVSHDMAEADLLSSDLKVES